MISGQGSKVNWHRLVIIIIIIIIIIRISEGVYLFRAHTHTSHLTIKVLSSTLRIIKSTLFHTFDPHTVKHRPSAVSLHKWQYTVLIANESQSHFTLEMLSSILGILYFWLPSFKAQDDKDAYNTQYQTFCNFDVTDIISLPWRRQGWRYQNCILEFVKTRRWQAHVH
jgi:hypothetical protein